MYARRGSPAAAVAEARFPAESAGPPLALLGTVLALLPLGVANNIYVQIGR